MKPTLEQIKTDESVWPEGATHYISGYFTKWENDKEYSYIPDLWREDTETLSVDWYINHDCHVIPRPTKAEWVPEVGVECEAIWGAKVDWHECVILPQGKIALLSWINEVRCISKLPDIEFRQIKSERKLCIEQAHKELNGLGMTAHLNILYDAGMLKMKEPAK